MFEIELCDEVVDWLDTLNSEDKKKVVQDALLHPWRRVIPMANHSRWQEVRDKRPQASKSVISKLEQDFALAQMIHDLRCAAGLSQQELAQRMGTTQSAVSRLEEGSVSGNRVDTLARVASALGRHLVISFPEEKPKRLKDAIRVL